MQVLLSHKGYLNKCLGRALRVCSLERKMKHIKGMFLFANCLSDSKYGLLLVPYDNVECGAPIVVIKDQVSVLISCESLVIHVFPFLD